MPPALRATSRARRIAAVAAVLPVGMMLAAAAPAAAHAVRHGRSLWVTAARHAGPAAPLTLQQAAAWARVTRRPVVVSSLTPVERTRSVAIHDHHGRPGT